MLVTELLQCHLKIEVEGGGLGCQCLNAGCLSGGFLSQLKNA